MSHSLPQISHVQPSEVTPSVHHMTLAPCATLSTLVSLWSYPFQILYPRSKKDEEASQDIIYVVMILMAFICWALSRILSTSQALSLLSCHNSFFWDEDHYETTILWRRKRRLQEVKDLPKASEPGSGVARIQSHISLNSSHLIYFTVFIMHYKQRMLSLWGRIFRKSARASSITCILCTLDRLT